MFKQHSKYFGHLLFHLQKPTALIVHVFCYHLQIIINFLRDKETINSSELSALFTALQQATYQNNVSIYYDGYKDFTVTVSVCNTENIKRFKTYIYTPICFIIQVTVSSFNVSFTPFRHFDGFYMSWNILEVLKILSHTGVKKFNFLTSRWFVVHCKYQLIYRLQNI